MKTMTTISIVAVAFLLVSIGAVALLMPSDHHEEKDTVDFIDSRGNQVTLEYPVTGICCIGMHTAEYLNIMGVGDRVVAMDSMSLQMTRGIYGGKVADVGDSKTPNQDLILDADTKVIITQSSGRTLDPSIADNMAKVHGISVVYVDCYGKTMFEDAEKVAALFGEDAESKLRQFMTGYGQFDMDLSHRSDEASVDETYLFYFTSLKKFYNANSELDAIVGSYGGRNAITMVTDAGSSVTNSLSKEVLLDLDRSEGIDLILIRGISDVEFGNTYAKFVSDCIFEPIGPMKDHRVYVINTDYLAGPADIIGKICIAHSLGIIDDREAQTMIDGYLGFLADFDIVPEDRDLSDFVGVFGE